MVGPVSLLHVMPVNKIVIILDKSRAVYHQGEYLTGKIVVDNKYELKHDGLSLTLEGSVDVSTNFKSIHILDTFNGTTRTIPLVGFTYELIAPGRLPPGQTEVPFKMLIDESVDTPILYETYHGVFISIQYFLKCRIKRPLFYKDLIETLEFNVEYDPDPIGAPPLNKQPFRFAITPDSLSAAHRDLIPDFKIIGQLDSLICRLDDPVTGEFTIENCDAEIRSIELQLVRVETYGPGTRQIQQHNDSGGAYGGGGSSGTSNGKDFSSDSTEVQNIQIGDGNVLRNIPLDIYMVLPRLFTCPTLITENFRIGKYWVSTQRLTLPEKCPQTTQPFVSSDLLY